MSVAMPYPWKFVRRGGFDQVILESGEDILRLKDLDQKLWATLSSPVTGLEFDNRTLSLIDTNSDGRIRVGDILETIDWLSTVFVSLDILTTTGDTLPLAAIRNDTPEGLSVLQAAKELLITLGHPDNELLTLDDAAHALSAFMATPFNGDGIITKTSLERADLHPIFDAIVNATGGSLDAAGELGINKEQVETFFTSLGEAVALRKTLLQGLEGYWEGEEAFRTSWALFKAISPKIDDFFLRLSLAGYDKSATPSLNPTADDYRQIVATRDQAVLETLPLSIIDDSEGLDLTQGVNPLYAQSLQAFIASISYMSDISLMTPQQWEELTARITTLGATLDQLDAMPTATISLEQAQTILESDAKYALSLLITRDLSYEAIAESISAVEKAVRLRTHFFTLLNNFVVFRDFYAPGQKAIFQAGTLYIDGRSCDLSLIINDIEKHASMAYLAMTYLLYCDCTRRNGTETMKIAVAVTAGDSDNLMVGRNGLFYDADGNDWDATVVRIMDYPISVRQAFWSPYKKLGRFINSQIEKFAKSKNDAVDNQLSATATSAQDKIIAQAAKEAQAKNATPPAPVTPPATPAAAPAPVDMGKFAGIFAALGLALGAIGTALASIASSFLSLPAWQMPLVILGILLAISGPSMLLAWLKLRARNLAPLLDALGWAVNTKARINIPFGTSLSQIAQLPAGSSRTLADPYEEKSHLPYWIIAGVVAIAIAVAIYILRYR